MLVGIVVDMLGSMPKYGTSVLMLKGDVLAVLIAIAMENHGFHIMCSLELGWQTEKYCQGSYLSDTVYDIKQGEKENE